MNKSEITMANFCYNLSKQAEDIKNTLILLGIPAVISCYYTIKVLKKYINMEVKQ